MNIYDFDKTIYDGDSTAAFIGYCAKKYKKTLLTLFPTAWAFLLYSTGIYTKTQFKEKLKKNQNLMKKLNKTNLRLKRLSNEI